MTEIQILGHGTVDLRLATCSYRAFTPEMGFPLRTSVGFARGFKHDHEFVSELAPYGLLKINDRAEFAPKYAARVASKGPEMLAKLVRIQQAHPGETLVICCFEDVHQDGVWCHRQVAAEWFRDQLGLELPELSTPGDPRPSPGKGAASGHEQVARERKATALAIEAHVGGVTAGALSGFGDANWHDLAHAANVKRPPSDATKTRAIEILAKMDAKPQLVPDDPFEGLTP